MNCLLSPRSVIFSFKGPYKQTARRDAENAGGELDYLIEVNVSGLADVKDSFTNEL